MGRKANPRPRKVTIVRHVLPDGTRCKAGTPGSKKVTSKSDSYYLTLPKPGGGKERLPLGTTDEAVAWEEVRRVLDERHRERLGISDDRTRQAGRPIAEHVAEWIAAVEAGGVTGKRVRMLQSRVERIITLAKWARVGEIRKSALQIALGKLQETGHGKGRTQSKGRGSVGAGKGVSAQTRNHYLASVRQFAAWLVDEQRLPADPLAGLKGVSVGADRRHDRRVPSDEDVRVLFAHLQGAADPAPVRMGMTGPQRALGYAVAMCAGLRAGELRRLSRESFDLGAGEVRVSASSDKAKRRRRMALPGWLVERVRDWLDAGGGLWGGFPEVFPGRLLQADLAAARADWLDEDGIDAAERTRRAASAVCVYEVAGEDGPLYLDFHALRHWFISQLASDDRTAPSTLMAMSRHVDPRLTLSTYTHARRQDERDAAERLPRPGE